MNCHLICLCCLWQQFNLIIAFVIWPNASETAAIAAACVLAHNR